MFTKQRITLKNGETLSYIEQGNKQHKTLLLVHGNFSSGAHFFRAIKNLKEHFHILAPDLRGFGDSTYHHPISSLKELADDLILFLDALNINKAFVLGWSLGGGVVMEMAAHYPLRVEKLILVASTTHKGYPVFKKDDELKPVVGSIYASKEEMALDPVQVLPLLNAQKTQNFSVMDAAFGAMYLVEPEADERKYYTEEALKQRNLVDVDWAISTINMSSEDSFYSQGENTIKNILCPVLHLWGENDLWLAPKYMTLDNFHALEKQSTLITYEQCGHIIFIDQEIASTKDIVDFLKS